MSAADMEPQEPDAEVIQLHPAGTPEAAPVAPVAPGTRRPVVPEPLQRHNLHSTVTYAAGLSWHRARYHGLRSPAYLLTYLCHATRGVLVLSGRLVRWWHAPHLHDLVSLAVASGRSGHHDAMNAHKEGRKTRTRRGQILAVSVVLALGVMLALVALLPAWAWLLLAVAAVVVLAHHGRPAGKHVVAASVVPPEYARLSADIILRALGSLSLAGIDRVLRDGRGIAFTSPVTRDGPGWRVELDLPYGVTVAEVVERKDKLASGLRRPVTCVWPEPAADGHAGHLVLYVSDQPLRKMRQPAYPLSRGGKFTLFSPLPFGTDQRGRPVPVLLMFASLLIGSIPRMGKTVALRLVLLAAALDPFAELHVWELKGTGDCGPLERVAHAYGSGPDDATLQACLADLRRLHAELERRAGVIRGLDRGICPDSKVTPELAADRRLRLHPIVVAIDEIQEAFESGWRDEFESYCLAFIKRGPALGMMLVMATQRPDTKSLPTRISTQAGLRFCLRVMDQTSNDMVLGTGAYKRGISATMLSQSDKGVGWAVGFADEPQVVRTYGIDGQAAERICTAARAARQAAGRLTGHAAGHVPELDEPRSFAADALAVFDGAEVNLWTSTIAARLAERIPGVYADLTQDATASQLRALGVAVRNVREAGGPPRKGVTRADLEAATR